MNKDKDKDKPQAEVHVEAVLKVIIDKAAPDMSQSEKDALLKDNMALYKEHNT